MISHELTIWDLPRQVRARIAGRIARRETTQSELARKTGIAQGTISNILSGAKQTRPFTMYMLAEAAGLQISVRIAELELRSERMRELDELIAKEPPEPEQYRRGGRPPLAA